MSVTNELNHEHIVFPDFNFINTKAGLATAQNNGALYAKLLKRFVSWYQNHRQNFNEELQSDDKGAAARWAHSLKGSAGNLGATWVQEAAKSLEQACKTNGNVDEVYNLVEQELNKVLQELEAFIQQPTDKSEQADNIDMASLHSLLEQLNILIEDYDTEASEVAIQVSQALADSKFKKSAKALAESVDNYDFEQAQAQLTELEKQISGS